MASTFITSNSPYSSLAHLHIHHHHESLFPISKHHLRRSFHLSSSKPNSIKPLRFSLKDEGKGEGEETENQQQELDWKLDEKFKNMREVEAGNCSLEAVLEHDKKRAERKLRELDAVSYDNPVYRVLSWLARNRLIRKKERLEKDVEICKALDLNKLRGCFGLDTFFAVDVRRYGDGGIFIGNLKRPIEEVMPKLEKKLLEATGREVVVLFNEEKKGDVTKQVCMVQPKSEINLVFECTKLSTPRGYTSAIALCVTTLGTIAIVSGFFVKPDATLDDYLADVVPLFGGFLLILGVSEIATRVTANRYGVKLSPSFLVPSNWTGCLGVMNNYESLLPNKKALFDIPAARTASAYLTSLFLAIAAFITDGSFNGGDNAMFIRPQFFYNNPLLSFIQFVIGPYADDLGIVLPNSVEGVGVPVDPLAFAGLLGMVVTSLNLLPYGRLEGGRIAHALFGKRTAKSLSFATSLLLGIGGLSGSVLCLVWGLFAIVFRRGEEIAAKDEITPLGDDRYAWGAVLFLICFLALFPNGGGTFSCPFFSATFFGDEM
ncbi:Probable zinc metallopeptidase egy3, chloroplastic [Dionaea muscipula]